MKIVLSFMFLLTLLLPASALAQEDILNDVCSKAPASTACKNRITNPKDSNQNPLYGPNGIITRVIKIMSLLVAIASVIFIIVAGLKYITSGNNPEEVNKAREYIIYALIALIIVAVAQLMVRYILSNIA